MAQPRKEGSALWLSLTRWSGCATSKLANIRENHDREEMPIRGSVQTQSCGTCGKMSNAIKFHLPLRARRRRRPLCMQPSRALPLCYLPILFDIPRLLRLCSQLRVLASCEEHMAVPTRDVLPVAPEPMCGARAQVLWVSALFPTSFSSVFFTYRLRCPADSSSNSPHLLFRVCCGRVSLFQYRGRSSTRSHSMSIGKACRYPPEMLQLNQLCN